MTSNTPEILAPAGNFAALKAAIGSGADAVYLGLNKFNARAKADNFSLENISEVLNYAHLFGVRVYITMNTLLKDSEINEALSTTKEVWQSGADAIIVQDLGFAEKLKEKIPDIVLHSSTQMGIHNYLGAKVAEKLGFKRVILSRETTLEDIKQIKENSSVELEFFVHGALCVAFSGNCYFSSLASGYSGNRGKCMQLCRKKYTLKIDECQKEGYFLSAKDLNNSSYIKELYKAGIKSFKIEGRLRRPEYVATVTSYYKKTLTNKVTESDFQDLMLAFNRGNFCNGHLFNPTSDTIYPFVQNNIGIGSGFVAKCSNGIATLSQPLKAGDGIKFLRKGIEVGSASVKSDGTITGFSGDVKKGDEVRLTDSDTLSIYIKEPKIPMEAKVKAEIGKPLNIFLKANNKSVSIDSDFIIEESKTSHMAAEDILKQMKFNDTEFECVNIKITADDEIFIPKSKINETRRNAINKLKALIISNYTRENNNDTYLFIPDIIKENNIELLPLGNIIQIDSTEKQKFIKDCYVAVNPSVYDYEYLKIYRGSSEKLLLSLPNIARTNDLKILERIINLDIFYGYIVNNLYGLELLKNKRIFLGWQMNFINSEIKQGKIASPEADALIENAVNYTFGYIPVMTFTHCPRKSLGMKCETCKTDFRGELRDEKHMTFALRHYSVYHCYAQLMNCLPLYNPTSEYKFIDLSNIETREAEKLLPLILKEDKLPIATTKGNRKRGLQ